MEVSLTNCYHSSRGSVGLIWRYQHSDGTVRCSLHSPCCSSPLLTLCLLPVSAFPFLNLWPRSTPFSLTISSFLYLLALKSLQNVIKSEIEYTRQARRCLIDVQSHPGPYKPGSREQPSGWSGSIVIWIPGRRPISMGCGGWSIHDAGLHIRDDEYGRGSTIILGDAPAANVLIQWNWMDIFLVCIPQFVAGCASWPVIRPIWPALGHAHWFHTIHRFHLSIGIVRKVLSVSTLFGCTERS